MKKLAKQRNLLRADNWAFLATVGFLLLFAGLTLYFNLGGDITVTALAGRHDPRIPLGELDADELYFFDFPMDATTVVRFVVQRGEDDSIRVAYASCPLCYASGRPSKEWRGQLICGHCNHRMRLPEPDEPAPEKKGCVPIAIPYVIEGEALIIRQEAIREFLEKWYTRTGKG